MLVLLARLAVRAPRRVLLVTALLVVAAAVFGAPVAGALSSGGFDNPDSESARADALIADRFAADGPDLIVLLESRDGVDAPAAADQGRQLADYLAGRADLTEVRSYWTSKPAAGLRSDDGAAALLTARIQPTDGHYSAVARDVAAYVSGLSPPDGVTLRTGGETLANSTITDQVKHDFAVAEAVTLPITAVVLVWVFGSLVAGLLPLITGLIATAGTLAVLRLITLATDVSVFALNLTTGLALALSIDYSLLLVSRYREEVRAGCDPAAAVRRTLETAGRTVLFSALIVALSLSSLVVFPLYFLRSFAYTGVAVVAFAALSAVLVVPAMLVLAHRHLERFDLRRPFRRLARRPRRAYVPPERTAWFRLAGFAMRRALPVGLATLAVLLLLGAPFLGVRWGPADERLLPPESSVRVVGETVRDRFGGDESAVVTVLMPDRGTASAADLAGYGERLSAVAGVTAVTGPDAVFRDGRQAGPNPAGEAQTDGAASYWTLTSRVDPLGEDGTRLLDGVRAVQAPGEVLLTGPIAQNTDSLASLADRMPLAVAVIGLATLLVVFMFTGSLLLPVKALVLTALSLTATFGAMVWIFQDGHLLQTVFGSTSTGYLVATMPVLMFCMSFGMSMDYEVFLLSRICEEWRGSARRRIDNTRAVQYGLARSGRIVSAAALLMGIVFVGMTTSQVSVMQMFGLGLATFVLIDATLIRGLLLPSFMHLAGLANWWAPGPLRRWFGRHGWREGETRPLEAAPGAPVSAAPATGDVR